ncbi:Gfo/Idh/MocA family oxidoreductase [Opitutia bacterium ISCC 51]|nr:Gfo/Idh/MocA family oxidoreductase [Opitutae bacterium ISCC 51]QXD29170.1 Gfo/Idh/MocA family oxidoreductase [Opitutae bacterium ISCC 52]
MTNSQPKRIAFIGAGDISLLHAEAIAACPSAELAGLWSIDVELNQEKAERYRCPIYESAEDLVADPSVDAVFILTNLETHTQYATLAMNAGKAVLIEKPLAPTISELEQLKACAEKNGVVLCPGHNYIHEPSLHRTRELLHSGRLGKLVAVYIHYHIHHPEEVARRYPGVIRHILTHHSYLLSYLGEPYHAPVAVSAMKSVIHYDDFEGEDLAILNLRLNSGAIAHFCADFAADDHSADPWTFVVKVIGTDGATRFSYRDWVENKPGVVHSHTWSAYGWHIREEVRHFIEECLSKGTAPLSTIDDAITAQRIIEASEQSIAERREIDL